MNEDTVSGTRVVSVSRVINASAVEIFGLLADPAGHELFDGSDTVRGARSTSPERLSLGAKFSMDMKLGVPYRMTSEVVEFEENRVIAWRHFGHHVWRYSLEEVEGGTLVTESFDWAPARFPPLLEWLGYPDRNRKTMTRTLEHLEEHLCSGRA